MQKLPDLPYVQFHDYLKKGSKKMGIMVSDTRADLMYRYADELLKWNKKINLTAIKNPFKIAEKHFIDSIASIDFFENEISFLDMGSGGGFPGIPLKIMNPALKIILVDASRKKINFLKQVIRILQLKNIDAIHSRIEDLHDNKNYKTKFDAVISRAFTHLEKLVELAVPFLKKQGNIYAMKGKNADQEITRDILKNFDLKTFYYKLPFEKSDRCMIKLSVK